MKKSQQNSVQSLAKPAPNYGHHMSVLRWFGVVIFIILFIVAIIILILPKQSAAPKNPTIHTAAQ